MIREKDQRSFWKRHFKKIIFSGIVFLGLAAVSFGAVFHHQNYISRLYKYYFEDKSGLRIVAHQKVGNYWQRLLDKDAGKHACFAHEVKLRTGKEVAPYSGFTPDELAEGGCLLVNRSLIKGNEDLYCSESSIMRFFLNPCLSDADLNTNLIKPCWDFDYKITAAIMKSVIASGRIDLFSQLATEFPEIPYSNQLFIYRAYLDLLAKRDFGTARDLEMMSRVFGVWAEDRRAAREIEGLFYDKKAAQNLAGLRLIAAKAGIFKKFRKHQVLRMIKEETDELGRKAADELIDIVKSINEQ